MRACIVLLPLLMLIGCEEQRKAESSPALKNRANDEKKAEQKKTPKQGTVGKQGDEKKTDTPVKPLVGKLSKDDAPDRVTKRPHQVHEVTLKTLDQGAYYQIELASKDFKPYLRLEDASGDKVAERGAHGDGYPAKLIVIPSRASTYRIIATTEDPKSTGSYSLTIRQLDTDKTATAPIPKDKWNLSYFEKTWALKVKDFKFAVRVTPSAGYSGGDINHDYKFLLEFSKDLKDDELKAIKGTFGQSSLIGVEFYFFDPDNVVVGKSASASVRGELTGVKGDAFWLVLDERSLLGRDSAKGAEIRVKRN